MRHSYMRHRSIRDYFLLGFAIVFTIVCVNLGLWQLQRRAQRQALNSKIVARLGYAPIAATALPRDSSSLHYKQVRVRGVYDYAHQIMLVDRSRNGSPGVNIITPVRIVGTDTAVLVNRGWVYAPDGVTADASHWTEGDSVNALGYARPLSVPYPGSPDLSRHPRAYRWLDLATLSRAVPYPLFPFTIVLEEDSVTRDNVASTGAPPRVPPPPLDEGPHMSYAIQWFAFATIAVVGSVAYLRSTSPTRDRDDEIVPRTLQ
ncbi:MAG: SURF1 family protein [Gemmatimonadaceae bacterium]